MADGADQTLEELERMLASLTENTSGDAGQEDNNKEEPEENQYCIGNGAYVRVDEDGMTAWLYLNAPGNGEAFYSRSDIVQFINENNVIKGLHDSNISAIAKKHIHSREVIIAKGQPAVEGKNGFFEYFFETPDKRKPAIREDGSVDYASVSRLSIVRKGDKVAEYHHAVMSINGFDVYGREIHASPSHELPPLRGRSITNEGNPDIYYATTDGRIEFNNDTIDIKNEYEFKGDVDIITGRVEFFGDIHITGNVNAGVLIRASRNVTVDGVVEGATIFAGGDIILSKGIQGNEKGHISARGNVSAEFIEHATIEADGNVKSNTFLSSDVTAKGTVTAEGKNGAIIGGHVRGLQGVSATAIGNVSEVKTIVTAGYTVENFDRFLECAKLENKLQAELAEMVDSISDLIRKRHAGLETEESLNIKVKVLNGQKDKIFKELDDIRFERAELKKTIEKGKGASIIANEKIFRGTVVVVEGLSLTIQNSTSYTKYTAEGGRVATSVISI